MDKKLLLLVFVISGFIKVFSQGELKVKLTDSETNEPISFATVIFKETNRGIIADYEGQFRLPFQDINNLNALIITSVGYKTLIINPKDLNQKNINVIRMQPKIENLETIVLNTKRRNKSKGEILDRQLKVEKKMLGEEIVRRAISKIPFNLRNEPHSIIGYYRDYQFVNNEYYNLNEGILEQFDSGVNTNNIYDKSNQAAFYSLINNEDFKSSKRYMSVYDGQKKFIQNAEIFNFGGNELSILNIHNPIRNYDMNTFSYVYQFNKDFITNHKFSKSELYFKEEDPIIEISFSTRTNLDKGSQNRVEGPAKKKFLKVIGTISISLIDYAIHGFTYSVIDYKGSNPLFTVKIEYKKFNQKMYLNYITFNNRFKVAEDFIFKKSNIFYDKSGKFFEIVFNNEVDLKTLKKRRFKARLKGRRIIIKDLEVISPSVIHLKINDFDGAMANLNKNDMKNLDITISGIKDVDGREVDKARTVVAYQYREFFTQEVFENRTLDYHLKYISKNQPLDVAPINSSAIAEKYIINSPLIEHKNK